MSGIKEHQFIPHLKKDFEIAAALVNAFASKIVSDKDDYDQIVDSMLSRSNQGCQLPSILQHIPASLYTVVRNLTLFPKFSYEDLKKISQGSYQIRQAPSYCQVHLRSNNDAFNISVCDVSNNANIYQRLCGIIKTNTSTPLLLMLDLKSRFRTNVTHKVHILLSSDDRGRYVVNEYCCTCKHGRRTVGCCSHVLSLIWFTLFIDQSHIKYKFPSTKLDSVFENWSELFTPESDIDSSMDSMSEFSDTD